MSFILSDILPTMAHSHCAMIYGIVGTWLSSPRTFIGSWSVVGFSALWYLSHCGIVPLWGLIRLLSGFPPQILYSHCGVKPSGLCVNFSTHVQYHVPLRHGIVGTRKPSPRTFIGQWAGGAYPTLCIVGYGGMSVCRHCVSFAYIIIIQDGGGKSNEKNMF